MKTAEEWADELINNQIEIIEKIQKDAYNQALKDLADNDLLVDKNKNLKKYKK